MQTEIESGILPPAEKAPKKTRARKNAEGIDKKKTANPAASLIAALKFIAVAQKKAGPTGLQFAHITNKWAAAYDGILTVAHPIEEDLEACPHTLQFIDALSKASGDLSITQLTANCIAVSSGAFRALVPCVNFDEVPIIGPDPQCAAIDDRIKQAFAAVAGLATDGAQNAAYASVLLQANTAVATNGAALLEYWHGIDLPPGLLIPRNSANAVIKAPYPLTGFGFSQTSVTFYFEGGSFIKTQLYGERYPNYAPLLDVPNLNPWVVSDEFFKAVRAVESFSKAGNIYFDGESILSNQTKDQATTYKIEGLPQRMSFSAKVLLSVEHAFNKAHFYTDEKTTKVYFFGDNVRGLAMGIDLGREYTPSDNANTDVEDDIAF